MVETIRALIGSRPFVIVGESFAGGHCGLYVTAKMKPQVKGMVLVSPGFVEECVLALSSLPPPFPISPYRPLLPQQAY
jgi:alpha-beta hydrolase superfamily lysophospholipase